MDKDSQFPTACTELSAENLASINLTFSVTGVVCCFISTVIVVFSLICKAYRTVLQRLFLYLMIATAVRELFLAASIEHQLKYPGQDTVCKWIAFAYNWTGILLFVFTVGILIYLFFLVRYVAKGNTVPQFFQSKRRRVCSEVSYVTFSVILTVAYASEPLITKDYGLAGGWCWIRALDENCNVTRSGFLAQVFQGYIFYESGVIIGMILMVAVAVVYCRLPISLQEARLLIRKMLLVILCFFVSLIITNIALSMRMITARTSKYSHFALWITVGVVYPTSLLLFQIAFLFSFYPMNKLYELLACCKCLHFLSSKRKKHKVHFEQVPAHSTHAAPTFPESSRVSAPSNTIFQVPYTNDFTLITENGPLVQEEQTDTGYGSVSAL